MLIYAGCLPLRWLKRARPCPLLPGAQHGAQGEAIERFAQMTDWSYYEAARRFQRVLDAAGINAALRAAGIQVGRWGECQHEARAACCPGTRHPQQVHIQQTCCLLMCRRATPW